MHHSYKKEKTILSDWGFTKKGGGSTKGTRRTYNEKRGLLFSNPLSKKGGDPSPDSYWGELHRTYEKKKACLFQDRLH